MRALISGGTGFAGVYLADFLAQQGKEVFVLSTSLPQASNLGSTYFKIDLRDFASLQRCCEEVQPDEVYHLAAISSVSGSWNDPRTTFEVNVLGTYNLMAACLPLASQPRFLNVSSGQVYAVAGEGRLSEDCPVRPASPYAASKAMAELLLYQFPPSQQERVVTARAFNHSGPRQTAEYALSDFAHQIAEMEMGLRAPVLTTGDLELERDFTDVRDVVRAYVLLLQRGRGGELYNVCSGVARRLASACAVLQSLTSVQVTIRVVPEKVRPGQPQRICGDPGRLMAETGWLPTIPWETMLGDLLQHWRERVHQQAPAVQ